MMNDLPACKNVSTISLDLPFELFIFAFMSTFVIDFPLGTTRKNLYESSETEFLSGLSRLCFHIPEKTKTFLWQCCMIAKSLEKVR